MRSDDFVSRSLQWTLSVRVDVDSGVVKQLLKQPPLATLTWHGFVTTIPLRRKKSIETRQSTGLQESVDTCVKLDRNRLCCLLRLANLTAARVPKRFWPGRISNATARVSIFVHS